MRWFTDLVQSVTLTAQPKLLSSFKWLVGTDTLDGIVYNSNSGRTLESLPKKKYSVWFYFGFKKRALE